MDHRDEYITEALGVPGGHLAIGRGGCTLYCKGGARCSGLDPEEMKARCLARGLPVIDTREVPFEVLVVEVVSGPLIAVDEEADPEPWGSLSKAPLAAVARRYRDLGAAVFNLALDEVPAPSGSGEA